MARMPARHFQDLLVWQKSHAWVLATYKYTECFPKWELYGLTSQLRRAAVSVPANIAAGFKKRGWRHKARFLSIAQGSLEECRYYLILSKDLGYGEQSGVMGHLEEVSKLLDAYTRSIHSSEQ